MTGGGDGGVRGEGGEDKSGVEVLEESEGEGRSGAVVKVEVKEEGKMD